MRRIPIRTATAVKAAVAAAAFGGLIAGCAPVQMGAAATVGSDSISSSQLNTEVTNLTTAAKPYSSAVQLTAAQVPKDVLGWLIRFKVRENLASNEHLTVTASQRDQALADIYQQASAQAQQQGVKNVTLTELAVANGLPPNLLDELGRYQAIEIAYAEAAQRRQAADRPRPRSTPSPSSSTRPSATQYKNAPVKVNPQYGTLNYSQYTVVAAPDTLSRASGTPPKPSTAGTSPSC